MPGAVFTMGATAGAAPAADRPSHRVELTAYCIDRTEVTVWAWRACEAAGECPAAPTTVDAASYERAEDAAFWSRFCNGGRRDRDAHPINCVDWWQADTFCHWSGGRLPTEAEWEYAGRGQDLRTYPWGEDFPDATRANASRIEARRFMATQGESEWDTLDGGDDGWPTTSPVGFFAAPRGASPFGLHDMIGNVREWTADWYAPYVDEALAVNPQGPPTGPGRVVRGGSWRDSDAASLRVTTRDFREPGHRTSNLGFRCVRAPSHARAADRTGG